MRADTMHITIRQGQPADSALLCALAAKTFYDAFAPFNTAENMQQYMSQHFTEQQFAKEIGEAGSRFFIAFDGEVPAGYARVRPGEILPALNGRKAMEIERIYADSAYHGKAVGPKLLHTCIDHAVAQGVQTIWLGVWEHNPRAIAFYTKHGFEKFGEHAFVVGTDAQTDWLMKKELL